MKNKLIKHTAIILCAAMLNCSCATILAGAKDTTHVKGDSIPEGTEVYYNGSYECDAPCNVRIPKSAKQGHSKIEIKAEGYETQAVDCHRKISIGWAVADICLGVIPLLIDFASGSIYKPRPNTVEIHLKKKEDKI